MWIIKVYIIKIYNKAAVLFQIISLQKFVDYVFVCLSAWDLIQMNVFFNNLQFSTFVFIQKLILKNFITYAYNLIFKNKVPHLETYSIRKEENQLFVSIMDLRYKIILDIFQYIKTFTRGKKITRRKTILCHLKFTYLFVFLYVSINSFYKAKYFVG